MGLYLKKANDDRERLAEIARRAQEEVTRIKTEGKQAIDQANQKIAHADAEIAKAQAQLQQAQEERTLLSSAQTLLPPTGKTIKGWKDAINLPLGVSLKYPTGTELDENDATGLILVSSVLPNTVSTGDRRWLSITPFDERLERELSLNLTSSTAVSYAVRGRLLTGLQGSLPGQSGMVFVLRVRSAGTASHIIWGKEPIASNNKTHLVDVLSTLDFSR
jgi:hypothetical protein